MDAIKAFFAKDLVKVIAGGIYVVCNVLLFTVVPEGALKTTLVTIWNGLIMPLAVFFGITSGGTSSQVSDATKSVRTDLAAKNLIDPATPGVAPK